ncbi:MAG: hypothetical protein U0401_07475 [Anaerolineae bacterium]
MSQQMDSPADEVPTRTVFIIVMVISAALAGLVSALLSSIFFLSPTSGFNPMLKSLVVTIFGSRQRQRHYLGGLRHRPIRSVSASLYGSQLGFCPACFCL